MDKHKILLLILFLLFIFSRVFILFNSRPCFDEEVCFIASLAKDYIEGLKMPFLQYIPTYYDTSTLIFPIPLVPLFLLFGYSTLVLNFYGLIVYSILFLIFPYLILKKYFGFKPAFINSILLIFSYFLISCFSISAKGIVILGTMCTLILIYLFMNIYFDNKDNLKNLILFGFLCGLFLWLNYIVAIVLLLFILFFYFTDKLFFTRKKFLIFLSSFFLGFLPRIIYEYSKIYTAEYIEMFGGKYIFIFNLDKLIYVKNKLIDFLLYRMPLSFSFKDFYFIKGTFFDYFYYFIFISVFIFFIFIYRKYLFKVLLSFIPLKRFNLDKNKNLKIIFLLMYIIIFVVIYIFSPLSVGKLNTGFFIGYRYLLPLHFVMLMLVSIFLAGLCQKRSHLFNINKKM